MRNHKFAVSDIQCDQNISNHEFRISFADFCINFGGKCHYTTFLQVAKTSTEIIALEKLTSYR